MQPSLIPAKLSPPRFGYHYGLHPKIYIAPYTTKPVNTIDADMNKDIWTSIPWSTNFDDIRGSTDAPDNERPTNPECRTRMKMTWDDDNLYILAMIESDFEVRATFTERNEPIYQQDSDFEVFVDPLGSCHFYKEMEMNPLNTIWNLMLDRPYWDGGSEHSGRIALPGEEKFYDVDRQKTAVRVIEGSLNEHDDEHDDDDEHKNDSQRNVWVVEVALNHHDTLKHITMPDDGHITNVHPKIGDRWRINFSRVEKKGHINWTWQEQRVWDASSHRHMGKVDMHLPDAWGYIQFGGPQSPAPDSSFDESLTNIQPGEIPTEEIKNGSKGDPLWPLRLAVANVYYAQRQYKEVHDKYANDLDALKKYVDSNVLDSFDLSSMKLIVYTRDDDDYNEDGFLFQISDNSYSLDRGASSSSSSSTTTTSVVSITHKRLIEVKSIDTGMVEIKDER